MSGASDKFAVPLNAYRLNEFEWWSGRTVKEAIANAEEETGVARQELIDPSFYDPEPADRAMSLHDVEGNAVATLGDVLDEMSEPGFVCGIDG